MSERENGKKKPPPPPPPFCAEVKLGYMALACGESGLSRADLATLMVIANRINKDTGLAWPSFARIASDAAITHGQAKKSVKKLDGLGLLKIVEHGDRTRSNRYSIDLSRFDRKLGGIETDTTHQSEVVSASPSCGIRPASDVISAPIPESLYQSENKSRIDEGSFHDGDASPVRPVGASGDHRPGEDLYPEFWLAFPARTTVYDAEQRIKKLIDDGIAYQSILDGANSFKSYCNDNKQTPKLSAFQWLKREKWRDIWTPNLSHKTKSKTKPKTEEPKFERVDWLKRLTDNPDHQESLLNPKLCEESKNDERIAASSEFKEWADQVWHVERVRDFYDQKLEQHTGDGGKKCPKCMKVWGANDISGCCATGRPLLEASARAHDERWRLRQEADETFEGLYSGIVGVE